MHQGTEPADMAKQADRTDLLLVLFLLPLYFFVWGRFGQKFAAGALLSMATGACCWFAAVVSRPAAAAEAGAEPDKVSQRKFGWQLFLLFPVFCPLTLPLWLIPIILVAAYLLAYSSFGGYGRQVFNPVAVAVVFMLVGYGHTASLHPVRPLPGPDDGFRIWNAGMASAGPVWQVYAQVPQEAVVRASYSGLLPAIPGSAFGLPLLLASAVFSLIAGRRRIWWVTSVMSLQLIVLLWASEWGLAISPLHPLLLGIVPGLLLVAVVDRESLPEDFAGQLIGGLLFATFALLFIFRAENLYGPAYGLLLAQIVSPLLTDLLMRRGIS